MPKTDFYNTNKNRRYPIQYTSDDITFGGVALHEEVILDAGFIVGLGNTPDPEYRVYLTQVEKGAGIVTFTFTPAGASEDFEIECSIGGEEGDKFSVDTANGGNGFIVIGELDDFYNNLTLGVTTADSTYEVEKALVQYLDGLFVSKVNLASEKDDPGVPICPDPGEDYPRWQFKVTGTNRVGTQLFIPGYNSYIKVNERNNYIEIGAKKGAGEGEPCERPDLGDGIPSIDNLCAEGITTINGIAPTSEGIFKITGSPGIIVENQPDDHKIIIKFQDGYYAPFCVGDS